MVTLYCLTAMETLSKIIKYRSALLLITLRKYKMPINFRAAKKDDLTKLVALLADDDLGKQREDISSPINNAYLKAFEEISQDPNNQLIIAERDNCIVGMLQLTYIPYLTHIGSWRCLIEGVRIHKNFRGKGFGKLLFEWAIEQAKNRNCNIVQLTSDKNRPDAIRFYNNLGFQATHEGFKLILRNT